MPEDPSNRPVNMKDIAKEAGVSQSTVSRALRNDPRITEAVRKRVASAAKKLNYTINPYISALTTQVRSYRCAPTGATIALLDCDNKEAESQPYYRAYVSGVTKRAKKLGFTIDRIRMEDIGKSFRTLNRILQSRSITGLLILPVPQQFHIDELEADHLAVATLDTSLHHHQMHRAIPDYFQGMLLALETLKKKGYRRIGFCTHITEIDRIGSLWNGAYLHWQSITPKTEKLPQFIGKDWNPEGLKKWMDKNRPDVIVSNMSSDYNWLQKMGIRIPEELAYASLGVDQNIPKVSGIDQRFEDVGASGIDLVVSQIYRNEYGLPALPKCVSVESCWVEKDSTPDINSIRRTTSV
jgi:LacI family transcriptional regulator